jgi:hypothetical protein
MNTRKWNLKRDWKNSGLSFVTHHHINPRKIKSTEKLQPDPHDSPTQLLCFLLAFLLACLLVACFTFCFLARFFLTRFLERFLISFLFGSAMAHFLVKRWLNCAG